MPPGFPLPRLTVSLGLPRCVPHLTLSCDKHNIDCPIMQHYLMRSY
jgi:hypothetical protein